MNRSALFLSALTAFSTSLLPSLAFAQGAGGQPPALFSFIPFILVIGVMYFFMIRPQIRRQKDHQSYLSTIKKGDLVLTSSGILGTIEGITELYVTLEVATGVRIKILKTGILGPANTEVKS